MSSEEIDQLEELISSIDKQEDKDFEQGVNIDILESHLGSIMSIFRDAYDNEDERDKNSNFSCEKNQPIKSGLAKFDLEHGNWVGGDLALLMGHSWDSLAACSMNIASHNISLDDEVSNSRDSSLFFSLRKPSLMAALSFCSFQAGFSVQEARSGDLDGNQWRELAIVTRKAVEMRNFLLIDNLKTKRDLTAICYALRNKLDLKVIVIDGFEVVDSILGQDDQYYQNIGSYRDKEYASLLKSFKDLATELDVLVIL